MPIVFGLDTKVIRAESQRVITTLGGPTCDWLPWLERTHPRSAESVVSRALIMNAMLQIHFGAPIEVIRTWIAQYGLTAHLSQTERRILATPENDLAEQERTNLYWYIEALWTLAWAGSLIPEIPVELPVGDELAALMPNLQIGESPDRLRRSFRLRTPAAIYPKLDLYYLAHWYARDGALRNDDTAPFNLDVIMERRKALEWVMDAEIEDWDETPDST